MALTVFASYLLYFSSFVLASLFAALYGRTKGYLSFIFFCLAISIPSLIAAIRGESVGTDYKWYLYHIAQFPNKINSIFDFHLLDSNFEIGFNIFTLVITRFTSDPSVVVFFIYSLIASFILLGAKKLINKKYVGLSFFLYLCVFWLYGYNGLRQAIAISILFFSICYVVEKKFWPFILIVILAISFHKTALLFLPVYFLYNHKNLKIEKINLLFFVLGIVLVAVFLKQTSYLIGMESYIQSKYAKAASDNQLSAISQIYQSLILLIPFFIWRKKLICIDQVNRLYFNILYLYLFVQILSFQITLASRLGLYFEIIIIPISLQIIKICREKRTTTNLLFELYVYFYLIIYKFFYIYSGSSQVIPYLF
jgi:transmembrane protein EpsG